jgi:putative transposase
MKRRHHTPEQIVRKVREAAHLLSEAKDIAEVLRYLEVSEPTLHRWRNQYGGMRAEGTRRLRELDVRTSGSNRSWPIRRWTSRR